MTRKISLVFFMFFIFMLNSCVYILSSTRAVRDGIMRNHPRVTAVGVIANWTRTDDNYIAVELKLDNDKTLFLPMVNYRKRKNKEPFYVSRVGNYAFATVSHIINKETNQDRMELSTNQEYRLSSLSAKTSIQLTSMNDIIRHYDEISDFAESLPMVNEDNYQEIFEEGEWIKDGFTENKTNFITTYNVKTIWDDKYYGTDYINGETHGRIPDYDNNDFFVGIRFLFDYNPQHLW